MSKKSDVWIHFIKNEYGGRCKHCHVDVKTKGNTTNLKNHLIRKHSNIKKSCENSLEEASTSGGGFTSSFSSNNRRKMESNVDEDSTSESESLQTKSILNKCTQPDIETCLSNIKEYKDGGVKAGKISNAIIYMIAKDNLPLNTVEKEGFKNLMKVVVPLYKVPGRLTITNMLNEKYSILSHKMKEKIRHISHVSLSTDVWTDTCNTRSFLGLTCHFVYGDELKSVSIGVTELNQSHTSNYLGSVLKTICEKWGITEDKIVAVVTDNGANIKKAIIDSFGKNKHLPCFGHTINLVASKPFEDTTELAEVKVFISQVKDIVRYFKHSVAASDELRRCQEDESQGPLKLIQSVSTRWNSVYYMLERFVLLSHKIAPILLKNSKAPPMLTASQLDTARDLIHVLGPLENITKEISGDKYVTISKVIPMIYCLRKEISLLQPKSPLGESAKKLILEEISKRFGAVEQVLSLAVSSVLDPRFKKIYFVDKIACSHAVTKIMNTLSEMKDENDVLLDNSPDELTDIDDVDSKKVTSLWKHHDTLIKENGPQMYHNDKSAEMSFYLNQPLEDLKKTNPIKFWNSQMFVNLRKIALQYLCITATSVPSERLFSEAGQILTPDRSRLSPERFDKLLFLNCLNKEEWFLN